MKDLQSKEHYCSKIHTLMETSPPLFYRLSLIYGSPSIFLLKKPFNPSVVNKWVFHTVMIYIPICAVSCQFTKARKR